MCLTIYFCIFQFILGMQSSQSMVRDCYAGADICKSYLLTQMSLWSTGYHSAQLRNPGNGEGWPLRV